MCDEPVDAGMPVNDPRGPSVDSRTADKKAKVAERLAHRGCNTRKGAVKVVIAWPDRLHVAGVEKPKRRWPGQLGSAPTEPGAGSADMGGTGFGP